MSKKKKPSAGKDVNTKPAGKSSSPKNERLISIFIFAFAFLLYANTFSHGYALDDDVVYLKNNIVQQGTAGLRDIFTHSFIYGFTGHNDQSYRPIVQTVYAFEKSIFDNSPHIQHFINVLFFSLSCLLLYKLLQKMFRKFSLQPLSIGNFQLSVPFIIALLFASHPVHTESAANIKGLDDILNFLFLVLSLLFIFTHVETGRKRFFVLSVLSFFLSLLCKETALSFVIIIPLTVFFFTNLPLKKIFLGALSFAGVLLIYFMIRKSALDAVTFEEKMQVINNALAAAHTEGERLATAFLMLGKYIQLLFFPHPLSFDYSYNQIPIVSFTDVKVIGTAAMLAALLGYAVFTLFKLLKQKPEARSVKPGAVFAYCILFFFLSIAVVSNIFILIGSTMGERFLFAPSLAFCIAVPFLLLRFGKNILFGICGVILVLFSYKTFERNKDWKDNFSLFLSAADACPNSSRVQSSLGWSYREQAEQEKDMIKRGNLYGKAVEHYGKAIEILPENTEALFNLGVCYYAIGAHDNALQTYQRVLRLLPSYTNAANNAGVIYFDRKDYDNAKKYFEQALQYSPNNTDALGNIGAIYHNQNNYLKAVEYYKKALAVNPGNPNVQANLAKAQNALSGKQ